MLFRPIMINAAVTLSFGLMLMASPTSYSTTLRPPLKLRTCEVMLGKVVTDQRSGEDAVSALGDLRKQLSIKASADDRAAADAVERINEITRSLLKTDLDAQVVTFVVRGAENLGNALAKARVEESRLRRLYHRQRAGGAPRSIEHVLGALMYVFVGVWAVAVPDVVAMQWNSFDPLGLVTLAFGPLMTIHFAKFIGFKLNHFDLRLISPWSVIDRLRRGRLTEPVIQSTQFKLPIEVAQGLVAKAGLTEDVRRDYLRRAHVTLVGNYMRQINFKELKNYLGSAGLVDRFVRTDHIMYVGSRGEPIWVYVFRSYRTQSLGRPPKKPEVRERAQGQFEPAQ